MPEIHVIAASYHNTAGKKLSADETMRLFRILNERFQSWTGRPLAEYAATELRPLDLSPVATETRSEPAGAALAYLDVLKDAAMRSFAPGRTGVPDLRVHAGDVDFAVPTLAGRPTIYCIAGATLPKEPRDRAREIVRRLAYGFHHDLSRRAAAGYHGAIKDALGIARWSELAPETIGAAPGAAP
jgi:hypothetical protein